MRKLMWFVLGFAGACILFTYFWMGKWAFVPAALGLIGAVALWRGKFGRRLSVVCLGLCLGFLWSYGYDQIYTQPLRNLDGQTLELELITCTDSWQTDYGTTVDCYLDLGGRRYTVRLYRSEDSPVSPWTRICTTAHVRLTTDGGYGQPTFHRSSGILALCYQRQGETIIPANMDTVGRLVTFVEALRGDLKRILLSAFPDDEGAFAVALLLGDRTQIPYDLSIAFQDSGISHLVAVSGLHMSILYALVYLLTMKRRYLLALFGIPLVVLFMALAGFTPSVIRAGIMQILIILALCCNREYDPPTALSVSVLAMLLYCPLYSASVGFQLSVGSVAGIFLFYDSVFRWIMQRFPEKKSRLYSWLRKGLASGISVAVSAQVITVPLVAIYFHTVSLVGIVTNLSVLWVVSLVFYGVMLVCLLGMVSMSWAAAVAWVVGWPIRFVLETARILSSLPLAAVYTESPYIVLWLALCYGLLILLLVGRGKRPLVSLCICVAGLCMALLLSWIEPWLMDCRVTVLDVGQGQCVILQHRGSTYVVDCGGDYADDAADHCARSLLSMGIRKIDGLILTHYDADHIGGAQYLIQRIDTRGLYLNPAVEKPDQIVNLIAAAGTAQVVWVEEDLLVQSQGLEMTLFAPKNAASGNESSIAVLFQTEKCDTLITGDMSTLQEQLLLKSTQLPKLEVLVVGHHGAQTSTSEELLEATCPEIAIISVGQNNRYRHPTEQTLQRLEWAGCRVYRTDQSGDIVFWR